MIIESLTNPHVKHLVKLQSHAYRNEHQQFLAQGFKVISTMLQAGCQAEAIYCTQATSLKYQETLPQNIIVLVTEKIMKKISTLTTAAELIAMFKLPQVQISSSKNAIVLYQIQDPGNVGTLIRTAAAMALDTVYSIESADPFSPKVIQATAGTIAYINVITTTWQQFQNINKNNSTCALVARDGKKPEQLDLKNSILIVGNESQGLPQNIIESCSQQLTIAMPGKTESLNASVAGAIAMYLKTKNQ